MNKKMVKVMLCIVVVYILGMAPQLVNAKSNKGINIKKTFVRGVAEEISNRWYDKNQDGYLSKKEIKQLKELYLYSTYENFNLKSISKLKYLEKIDIEPMYYLHNIKEIKKLKKLKYVKISMDLKRKKILDFRKSKNLKTLIIEAVPKKGIVKVRKNNKISTLSLWGVKNSIEIINRCKKVKTIEIENSGDKGNVNLINRNRLKQVYLCTNVKDINIRNCAKLERVELSECKSTGCTIENNPKLQFIKMYKTKAPNLTIQNMKGLKWINIDGARISKFSLNRLDNLRKIKLYNTKGLTDLSISNFSKLWKVDVCRVSDLQSFTVENLKNLKQMNCMVGKVTELNIVGDNKLKIVKVCDNKLKTFAYDNLKHIEELDINNNEIEGRFDFTLYPELYRFDCRNNRISEIYGGPLNREIGYIDCYNNNMKLLHFTELDKYAGYIFYVNCKKNPDIEVHAWMEDYDSDPTANIPYH